MIMIKKIIICLALLCVSVDAAFSMDEKERRDYQLWMRLNLPVAESFNEWQDETGELPPDFDELPACNTLPDPFTFFDGRSVPYTKEGWAERREEILDLYKKYELGVWPDKPVIDRVEVLEESCGDGYYSRNVRIWYGPEGRASVRASVSVPVAEPGRKYPVLLGTSLGGWGSQLTRRGYVSAGYAASDFMDDAAQLKDIYPDYDFSALTRRAWMASVVLDWFETIPEIDMEKVAVFGYSRDGKMAAIAAALDERFAAVVAGSTGVGGYVPWRYSGERGGGEGIESTTRMFPDWFIPRMRFFSGREDRLPVDANLLAALVAPRAVLMEWGLSDQVANGWAQEQAYTSAMKVYRLFGAEDKLGLMHVPGFHGSNDQEACIDFLDTVFGRTERKWTYDPVFAFDYDRWAEGKLPAGLSFNRTGKAPKNLKSWETVREQLLDAVRTVLGRRPVTLPSRGSGFAFMGRRPNPGPTEIAKGNSGNPGQLAPDVPAWVISNKSESYGWTAEDGAAAESKRLRIGPDNFQADLYYPAGTGEGAELPVVIWLHGFHYPLGYMWVYRKDIHPILSLVKAGFAVLAYDQTGHGMRYNEYSRFYDRFPEWSRLGRMVEDLSSAVDALQKEDIVDGSNVSVFGFTMGGTVAMYGAALDERISNVVSICGFTPEDELSDIYAMLPQMGLYGDGRPYSYGDLISLIAPRPAFVMQHKMDRLVDIDAVEKEMRTAEAVYKLYKADDNLKFVEPDDYARLSLEEQDKAVEWLKEHTK